MTRKSTYKEFMRQIDAYRMRKGGEVYESLEREFSKARTHRTH